MERSTHARTRSQRAPLHARTHSGGGSTERLTRARMRDLRSMVVDDVDLLQLVFSHCAVRDFRAASLVCYQWRKGVQHAVAAWRCRQGLYLVGGCCDGVHPASAKAVRAVYKYDLVGDEWVPCAALRKARDHLGLIGWGGRLHALGGWSGSRNRASCETYEPSLDMWYTASQRLQTARSGLAAAVSPRGKCFALAGWGGAHTGFLSTAECLEELDVPEPSNPDGGDSATPSPRSASSASLRTARHCPAAATVDTVLYVAGGSGSEAEGAAAQPMASVEKLEMEAPQGEWSSNVAPMLFPRYRHTLVSLGGALYACGGQKPDGRATASTERYDPRADRWVEVAPMRRPRFSHAAATLDGALYVVGGFVGGTWLTSVERCEHSQHAGPGPEQPACEPRT